MDELCQISNEAFTKQELMQWELRVMCAVGWRVTSPHCTGGAGAFSSSAWGRLRSRGCAARSNGVRLPHAQDKYATTMKRKYDMAFS